MYEIDYYNREKTQIFLINEKFDDDFSNLLANEKIFVAYDIDQNRIGYAKFNRTLMNKLMNILCNDSTDCDTDNIFYNNENIKDEILTLIIVREPYKTGVTYSDSYFIRKPITKLMIKNIKENIDEVYTYLKLRY